MDGGSVCYSHRSRASRLHPNPQGFVTMTWWMWSTSLVEEKAGGCEGVSLFSFFVCSMFAFSHKQKIWMMGSSFLAMRWWDCGKESDRPFRRKRVIDPFVVVLWPFNFAFIFGWSKKIKDWCWVQGIHCYKVEIEFGLWSIFWVAFKFVFLGLLCLADKNESSLCAYKINECLDPQL